jgi:hypothetical protein
MGGDAMSPIPEPVARIADVMAGYRGVWCLCGGWAVDAWVGQQTREHGDVDIAVFQDERLVLHEHLADWQVIPHDRDWGPDVGNEDWDGRALVLPAHFHARPPEASGPIPQGILKVEQGFWLDIQMNERSGDDWIVDEDARLAVSVSRSIKQSGWDVPTLVPELLLFYKAGELQRSLGQGRSHPSADHDFEALAPMLEREQRAWLREATALVHPAHPWVTQLAP